MNDAPGTHPSAPSIHIPTPALAPMISETSDWPFT